MIIPALRAETNPGGAQLLLRAMGFRSGEEGLPACSVSGVAAHHGQATVRGARAAATELHSALLFFQAFDRLYHASGEFLQALFISRRTYPIAYDKWIQEQLCEIVKLPQLYRELSGVLEVRCFESEEMIRKAGKLRDLLDRYCAG